MKKLTLLLALLVIVGAVKSFAQNIYPVTSGEMIFSSGTVEFTDEYMQEFPEAKVMDVPVRFTTGFNISQFWHFDFNEHFGLYTGLGIKNVGLISDEMLYDGSPGIESYQPYKIIRRNYTGAIPLAVKLGSFDKHLFIYGGGEFEFGIHYKEKYWNSHDRSGAKTKTKKWFGGQTESILPSAIVGLQFPRGLNVKFKYYLNDFFNHDYTNTNFVSDLTRYKTSQMWYLSLSWQFNTYDILDFSKEQGKKL